jgi:hypothetical protein
MSLTPAQVAHQQKIQKAKRNLEIDEGKTIDPKHIQEWALLEIAELLYGIQVQLIRANLPNIQVSSEPGARP